MILHIASADRVGKRSLREVIGDDSANPVTAVAKSALVIDMGGGVFGRKSDIGVSEETVRAGVGQAVGQAAAGVRKENASLARLVVEEDLVMIEDQVLFLGVPVVVDQVGELNRLLQVVFKAVVHSAEGRHLFRQANGATKGRAADGTVASRPAFAPKRTTAAASGWLP